MAERREVYGLRKSGEEFPAEASISKVTVGSETFFSVVLRDITYRKSVEAALERAVAARDVVPHRGARPEKPAQPDHDDGERDEASSRQRTRPPGWRCRRTS